jgi:hypothetical protein
MTFSWATHHTECVLQKFAVLFTSGTLLASQALTTSTQPHTAKPLTARQFNKLRASAHTSEDFRRLAEWCQLKAAEYGKNSAGYENEARQLYGRSSPQSNPKHPTRGEDLHALAVHCRELSKHWSELSALYTSKAAEMEGQAPNQPSR